MIIKIFVEDFEGSIVRPVKRDWAILSKDTPVDISILKSLNQSVFIHLWNALHLYIPIVVMSHFVRKGHFELIWITSTLTSIDIYAQTMFEILTIQIKIIILNKKRK